MDMRETRRQTIDEVELMLANARLRDELEPYRDESIDSSANRMSLQAENEYLASMLAWERAPALPISDWFSPPLHLLPPDALGDTQLSHRLKKTIHKLFSKNILLRCTDHFPTASFTRSSIATSCRAVKKWSTFPARLWNGCALRTRKPGCDITPVLWNADAIRKSTASIYRRRKRPNTIAIFPADQVRVSRRQSLKHNSGERLITRVIPCRARSCQPRVR